jgi:acyl-homoserine lactone acylase PvdQ
MATCNPALAHGTCLRRLKLSGDDGYMLDGAVKKFDTHVETVRVLQADGTHTEEHLEIRRSVHGPVVRRNIHTCRHVNVFAIYS